MAKPVLHVIIASTRPGRVGAAIAQWFYERALERDTFEVELVDLATIDLPLFNEPRQPVLQNYEFEHTKRWSSTVSRADAFVLVMPEYNHSFNAALKNALDYLYHEWRDKPVGLVSYGGGALGARAIEALKPVIASIGLAYTGEMSISLQQFPVVDGVFLAPDALESRARTLLDELDLVTPRSMALRLERDRRSH